MNFIKGYLSHAFLSAAGGLFGAGIAASIAYTAGASAQGITDSALIAGTSLLAFSSVAIGCGMLSLKDNMEKMIKTSRSEQESIDAERATGQLASTTSCLAVALTISAVNLIGAFTHQNEMEAAENDNISAAATSFEQTRTFIENQRYIMT